MEKITPETYEQMNKGEEGLPIEVPTQEEIDEWEKKSD